MELFATLAACAALSKGVATDSLPTVSQQDCQAAAVEYQAALQAVELSPQCRDAIARVAYAEAGNQGDSGLAGVVYTILNRLMSGRFGGAVSEIVNAPHQFEPVTKAGGWDRLAKPGPARQARIDTIINLALDGRLPDPTKASFFFQNPRIVAKREQDGTVSEGLTHFGGSTPSAVIRDHAFYARINQGQPPPAPAKQEAKKRPEPKTWDIYGQAEAKRLQQKAEWDVFTTGAGQEVGAYRQPEANHETDDR